MARNVAGERLTVRSITKLGAEIHGYQPTPSDLVKAAEADLIVENGLGLELWAKKFIAAAGKVPSVVLSDGMGYISRDLMHEVADQLGFSPGVLQVGSGDAVHVVLPHDSS